VHSSRRKNKPGRGGRENGLLGLLDAPQEISAFDLGKQLTHRGGTSLSISWKLIGRFSEDIDILINRGVLGIDGDNAPEEALTNKRRNKRLDALREAYQKCVKEDIRPALLEEIAADIPAPLSWELLDDPAAQGDQTLLFNYPTAFPAGATYLRRAVKLEMGAHSDTGPSAKI
jgi:hypothetical protein